MHWAELYNAAVNAWNAKRVDDAKSHATELRRVARERAEGHHWPCVELYRPGEYVAGKEKWEQLLAKAPLQDVASAMFDLDRVQEQLRRDDAEFFAV